jgi:hypothetical protein|tara:strand:- start:534 stop:917 length:384 start_codon:yes stop_codon:yes gene_type:complete
LAIIVTDLDRSILISAVAECTRARAADRRLDVIIATAVFPALTRLAVLDTGVWQHDDGTRVRALRYSASRSAASTLVPIGCWLEEGDSGAARVSGADGEWDGLHSVEEIAICIAALRARMDVDQFSV